MILADQGTPSREQPTRATVIVNVFYNDGTPTFTNCPTTISVLPENFNVGDSVYTVTVVDSDTQVDALMCFNSF